MATTRPAGRSVTIPGRGVTYVRDIPGPNGAPVVLLLHGWTATADLNWSSSFQALSQRYRVIALDHRGHGGGIRSSDAFTLEACADDAAALLRQLGVPSATVVGYSMGGPIAQLLWRRHPNLVAGLVLCATSDHFVDTSLERVLLAVAPVCARVSRLVPTHISTKAVQRLRRGRTHDEVHMRLAAEAMMRHHWPTIVECAAAIGRFDSRRWIGEVDVPTSVVLTTKDHVVPSLRQRGLSGSIRGASVHEVHADHDVCINNADLFVPALLRACADVTATSSDDRTLCA